MSGPIFMRQPNSNRQTKFVFPIKRKAAIAIDSEMAKHGLIGIKSYQIRPPSPRRGTMVILAGKPPIRFTEQLSRSDAVREAILVIQRKRNGK